MKKLLVVSSVGSGKRFRVDRHGWHAGTVFLTMPTQNLMNYAIDESRVKA
jgi:hypothetical protein